MNLEFFDTLMKQPASQQVGEWRTFLEICDKYLKEHNIKNPVVVELGVWLNRQKIFYEKLLNAEHIGIDIDTERSIPDIVGNTHDPSTLATLKEKLRGRPINILFIDAAHSYEDAEQDFGMYGPLCNGIIAFHDIEMSRFGGRRKARVWRYWDELKRQAGRKEEYKNFLFISIYQRRRNKPYRIGLGVIIKE